MDNREKLLQAASRVYAEVGFRGATTRRIADEAGVNEVTLFRLFGSKAQLIAEAVTCQDPMGHVTLPEEPGDVEHELTAWCEAHLHALRQHRSMIRQAMADLDEHPGMGPHLCRGQTPHFNELVQYVTRLLARHRGCDGGDVVTACSFLFNALFGDAMGREIVPGVFPAPAREAPVRYVRTFLRTLGLPVSSPLAHARAASAASTGEEA